MGSVIYIFLFQIAAIANMATNFDPFKTRICYAMLIIQLFGMVHALEGQMFFFMGMMTSALMAIPLIYTTMQAWAVIYSAILILCIFTNVLGLINYVWGYDDYIWMYESSIIGLTIAQFLTLIVASRGRLDFYFQDSPRPLGFNLIRRFFNRSDNQLSYSKV